MSALDFLFQGTPPTQVTNTGQNTSNVPTWLQEYAQGILASGAAAASQPYPTYPGPTVAGMTPYSTQAGSEVSGLQGGYQPTLNSAVNMATNAANPSALTSAVGMIPGAQSDIQSALSPTQAMMNPYINNVIGQAENQATQYWNNTLLPTIDNQFVGSGQAGSSANTRALGQAGAQVTQNIQDTANAALSGGYTAAQQAALQAGTGLGSLAQTQGGLGYETGILGEQGAGALGSLASTGQGLGISGASALDAAGQELQQNQQQNLNAGYNQFLQQQQYPYQQVGWLSSLMSGTIPGTTPGGTTTAQQTVPYQQGSGTAPISALSGLSSLFSAPTTAARGGHMHRGQRRMFTPLSRARAA